MGEEGYKNTKKFEKIWEKRNKQWLKKWTGIKQEVELRIRKKLREEIEGIRQKVKRQK